MNVGWRKEGRKRVPPYMLVRSGTVGPTSDLDGTSGGVGGVHRLRKQWILDDHVVVNRNQNDMSLYIKHIY